MRRTYGLIAIGCAVLSLSVAADTPVLLRAIAAEQRTDALEWQLLLEQVITQTPALQQARQRLRANAQARDAEIATLEATVCDGTPGTIDRSSLTVTCPKDGTK